MVLKIAGALLEKPEVIPLLARQISKLAREGYELLVVHGGEEIFADTLKRMGVESRFVNGLRVIDPETRDIAVMVLGGLLNKRLAGAISAADQPAIGLCASDAGCFLAEPLQIDGVVGAVGFAGYLIGINLKFLESLWHAGIVPVAASLGLSADGELYSVNADHMASACAEYVGADRLIYITDVPGVFDGSRVLKAVSCSEVEQLIRIHKVSGGMILKLEACKRALAGGVKQVRIVGGTSEAGLLSAANGQKGPGTRVTASYTAAAGLNGPSQLRRARCGRRRHLREQRSKLIGETLRVTREVVRKQAAQGETPSL
jgi:acetylglutamate kinase